MLGSVEFVRASSGRGTDRSRKNAALFMSSPPLSYDVLVVGGGPAGASCAAFCARAGLRVLVVERATFPRDKVCGDCLNPDAWPTLARLGVEEAVRRLPHVALRRVEFVGRIGQTVSLPLPGRARGEIAVRRRELDSLLLENAAQAGAEVWQGTAVSRVQWSEADGGGWIADLSTGIRARVRFLVAADGRNSVTARLAGLLGHRRAPDQAVARIGLQTHLPCPADFGPVVRMRWFARGYGGLAPVGNGALNVSLAGPPGTLDELKAWARGEFGLPADHPWRTIAPLDRAPAPLAASADGTAYLVGDSARVVEPFTGEGIYYALRSGELAAESLVAAARGKDAGAEAARYRREHRRMYHGRLWVNRLARFAGRNPRIAGLLLEVARWQPGLLRFLTAKVVS